MSDVGMRSCIQSDQGRRSTACHEALDFFHQEFPTATNLTMWLRIAGIVLRSCLKTAVLAHGCVKNRSKSSCTPRTLRVFRAFAPCPEQARDVFKQLLNGDGNPDDSLNTSDATLYKANTDGCSSIGAAATGSQGFVWRSKPSRCFI